MITLYDTVFIFDVEVQGAFDTVRVVTIFQIGPPVTHALFSCSPTLLNGLLLLHASVVQPLF